MISDLCIYILGKKYGFDMQANKKLVALSQYWSQEQIEDYQNSKLRLLIKHAVEHVPYYRNLFEESGLSANDICSVSDLYKLPIIRKKDVITNPDLFIADNHSLFKSTKHHTGGTTGIPFQFYNDRKSWALNWALKMRTFEWAGYHYGHDRLGVMAGGSLNPGRSMSFSHQLWRLANNYFSMPITHMTTEIMEEYYKELKKQKIKFVRGYPSALATFSDFLISKGLSMPMQAVFTTAEMLYPIQRSKIENVFCCKVFDMYGCGDGMGFATECEEHNGMHIGHEVSVLQIVGSDGREVESGETGEIVLTSLCDYTMPLIRYAPGDMAVKGETTCRCGRTMPMIKQIIGRTSDSFVLSNGRVINGLSIPLEDFPEEIKQFQIVQEAVDKVVVNIVPQDNFSTDMKHAIQKMMEHHCGEGIEVSVELVEEIEKSVSGKYRYVISKL